MPGASPYGRAPPRQPAARWPPGPPPAPPAWQPSPPPRRPSGSAVGWMLLGALATAVIVVGAIAWVQLAPTGRPDETPRTAGSAGGSGFGAEPVEGSGAHAINLVSAHDLGCTTDVNTPADPGVRITFDGREVLHAVSDQDANPLFAAWVRATPHSRSFILVSAYDEEGNNGPDTPCDVAPGPEREAVVHWDGSYQEVILRGDEARAIEVRLVLGQPPDVPSGIRAAAGLDSATVTWDNPDPAPKAVHWAPLHYGRPLKTAAPGASMLAFEGLCDNVQVTGRLVSEIGAWRLGSDPVTFRTQNKAPEPPQVLEADARDGWLWLKWQIPTAHDIERYEIHAGPRGFTPSAANRIATETPFSDWRNQDATVKTSVSSGAVRIVAVDTAGATSTSAEFAIGAPHVRGTLTFGDGC